MVIRDDDGTMCCLHNEEDQIWKRKLITRITSKGIFTVESRSVSVCVCLYTCTSVCLCEGRKQQRKKRRRKLKRLVRDDAVKERRKKSEKATRAEDSTLMNGKHKHTPPRKQSMSRGKNRRRH